LRQSNEASFTVSNGAHSLKFELVNGATELKAYDFKATAAGTLPLTGMTTLEESRPQVFSVEALLIGRGLRKVTLQFFEEGFICGVACEYPGGEFPGNEGPGRGGP
jgi:hypothetical protein